MRALLYGHAVQDLSFDVSVDAGFLVNMVTENDDYLFQNRFK